MEPFYVEHVGGQTSKVNNLVDPTKKSARPHDQGQAPRQHKGDTRQPVEEWTAWKPGVLHVSDVPPPPKWHTQINRHPLRKFWKEAEREHLERHYEMSTWEEVPRKEATDTHQQILGNKWIYTYKLDENGYINKCKARLVIRGDQQPKRTVSDTYASTLAARSFRTLLTIGAIFDLEIRQYDVSNAFVHADLLDLAYTEMPPGYRKPATILRVLKAMYGLRESPQRWQKKFTRLLINLGMTQVPHEPCCFIKPGVIVFVYVDDFSVLTTRKRTQEGLDLVENLRQHIVITGGEERKWFLGIRVVRDRLNRKIWLSQASYVDKVVKRADNPVPARPPRTPMTSQELFPGDTQATMASTKRYQRKIGSILYLAINTRPDIAFAVSRLARHLQNPSELHHQAADRVIHYLYGTRSMALRLGGGEDLVVATDSSFADNTLDRKSSQAFAIKLFGGLIAWRANKQSTVATSSTEAELLAMSDGTKEVMFINYLVKELGVILDAASIRVECDNQQTIRLVTSDLPTLATRLRHVDIHNHWLRSVADQGVIEVVYTESAKMMADGLTKALTYQQLQRSREQLGMYDIQDMLQSTETQNPTAAQVNIWDQEGFADLPERSASGGVCR